MIAHYRALAKRYTTLADKLEAEGDQRSEEFKARQSGKGVNWTDPRFRKGKKDV